MNTPSASEKDDSQASQKYDFENHDTEIPATLGSYPIC